MVRKLNISQNFWNRYSDKEFLEVKYEFSKEVIEFEKKQGNRMESLKELECKFVDISNSAFEVLMMCKNGLGGVPNMYLIKKEHELVKGQKGLDGLYDLNAEYLTIIHGPEGLSNAYDEAESDLDYFHPNYEQAATMIGFVLNKLRKEMDVRERKN